MKRAIFFILIFALANGSARGDWIPFGGIKLEEYPKGKWSKVREPENHGWSLEKLAKARNFSKKINSAAVMIVDNGIVIDAWLRTIPFIWN